MKYFFLSFITSHYLKFVTDLTNRTIFISMVALYLWITFPRLFVFVVRASSEIPAAIVEILCLPALQRYMILVRNLLNVGATVAAAVCICVYVSKTLNDYFADAPLCATDKVVIVGAFRNENLNIYCEVQADPPPRFVLTYFIWFNVTKYKGKGNTRLHYCAQLCTKANKPTDKCQLQSLCKVKRGFSSI